MVADTEALSVLKRIERLQQRTLALSEERLEVERRQFEAQDTQNVLAWLQLQQAQGHACDQVLMDQVRRRLRI
ncbi:hypothetical protein ACFVVC_01745 [Pseudarthrobacter sp. NPDC058196]|uniref:hypothetical protein n=1 Tax=Pseudarthrobacter sp. NPDC058196 TaxID=3346376 RepID=UPI0036D862BD